MRNPDLRKRLHPLLISALGGALLFGAITSYLMETTSIDTDYVIGAPHRQFLYLIGYHTGFSKGDNILFSDFYNLVQTETFEIMVNAVLGAVLFVLAPACWRAWHNKWTGIITFCVAFLGSPVLAWRWEAYAVEYGQPSLPQLPLVVGAAISGFALGCVVAKTTRGQLGVGILATLGVLGVYAGLSLLLIVAAFRYGHM